MTTTKKPFGVTAGGEAVTLFSMANDSGLTAQVLDYGCTLRALALGGTDVCLGYDTLAEYESQNACLGAVVGRYANRIDGGRFALNGKEYTLACNNGPNHLHGGLKGFDRYVWAAEILPDGLSLTRRSPDGEEGYPGNLDVTVTYRLTNENALEITYEAVTDADTVVNLTNHAYFNLTGGGDVLGHTLQISAARFTENDEACLPTGVILPVEGTPFDFRTPKPVGRDIGADCQQLRNGTGDDHNFILDAPGLGAVAARLTPPEGGLTLEVRTDLPGVQLYTANFLTPRQGKCGTGYAPRCALCLETQFFPDSPNHPEFPSTVLRRGDPFKSVTAFHLSTS